MNKPFIIGIAGGSGAGKTFFLKCFLNHFLTNEVCLISQDDYYRQVTGNMTAEENKYYNFDLPSTIDEHRFLQDVEQLIRQEVVYKEEYTFNNPLRTPKLLVIKPAPIILVEGLFILHLTSIAALLDFKIFIDTEEEIAFQRRLKRDLTERGYSRDDITYKWINQVLPAYQQYLLPYKNVCDEIITNNSPLPEDIISVTAALTEKLKASVWRLPKE